MKNKNITERDVDFAKWYNDVVSNAHLAEYSNSKGCIVFEPNGYAIWEEMQKALDKEFKKTGHKNVYMPLLIPENLMKKEGELIEGFAPEVAWVTEGGQKKLDERMCIRPTSETLFSDYYSTKVRSYKDLPMKYNQWCNVFRWEKETRPFLRSREFLWQEGHTIHATKEEAIEEEKQMLNIYNDFFHNYLAIPSIIGRKTEKEKFAGAEYTDTVESLMYNGVCLQSATSHYFGQKFSKAYNIKYVNKDNKEEFVYQTSWGASTRMIGGLIMVHSDDNGLVLPPRIAPTKVAIIPIGNDDEVLEVCNIFKEKLDEADITNYIDLTDKTPGFKFAEAEVNGIPVRVEVGKRDLERKEVTLARRDTGEKVNISIDSNIVYEISNLMENIQMNLYNKALDRRNKMMYKASTLKELEKIINKQPGFILAPWCGDVKCEEKVKEVKGCKSRCIPFNEEVSGKCLVCGKEAKHMVYWGIQY